MIALSETAINSTHATYNIPNYNVEMNYRAKKQGGGVSLYMHSTVQYKTRKDIQIDVDVNSVFIEILKTSFNTKCNVICGCVYRHPPFIYLKSLNVQLNSMLGKLQHENKHVYITGDFNVNMLPHIKSSLDRQDFKNICSSSFIAPLITKPTRVTDHSAPYAIFCISKDLLIGNKNSVNTKRNWQR